MTPPRYPDALRAQRHIRRMSLADLLALQARDFCRPTGWSVEFAWLVQRQIEAMGWHDIPIKEA